MTLLVISFAAGAQPAPSEVAATFSFAVGSSDLDQAMRERLDAIAVAVKAAPGSWVLEIVGHSDSSGNEALNVAVSGARAERVAAALVRRGVPLTRLLVRSLGASAPIATNGTTDGRGLNRRTEIHLQGAASAPAPVRAAIIPESVKAPAPVKAPEPADAPEPAKTPEPANASEPAKTPEPVSAPEPVTAPPADAPIAQDKPVSDAPRAEPMAIVAPAQQPMGVMERGPAEPKSKVRFWVAVSASVVAVAGAGTAIGYLVDSGSASAALASGQTQLARTDLTLKTRAAYETHDAALSSAASSDRVTAGVIGAVAVAAAVTAVVLWIQEASVSDAPVK